MNKNTLNAINRRLANGKKDFRIGENEYHLNDSGALWHYSDIDYGNPHLDGVVEGSTLNPDRLI